MSSAPEVHSLGDVEARLDSLDVSSGGYRALPYGTTIASTSARFQVIVATDTVAFTITPPTLVAGARVTYDIKNSSGGTQGAITWSAPFLLAGAFTNAANGKRRTISFYCDGTNWVETGRVAADI